jgi:predicted small secreted protein
MMKKAALLLAVVAISWLLAGCGQAVQHTYDKVNQVVTDYGKEKSINKEKVLLIVKEGLYKLYDVQINDQEWNLICGFSKYFPNQEDTKSDEGHVAFIGTINGMEQRRGGISGFYGEVNLKTGELYKLGILRPSAEGNVQGDDAGELQMKARAFIVDRLQANERTLRILSEKGQDRGVFLFQDSDSGMRYWIQMHVEQQKVTFFKRWKHM